MTAFGNSIEEYDVYEQVGKGGFGVVHRARCRNTGLEVAVKKISKEKIDNGNLITRVREEVRIHSPLNHPAIVKLYASFEDQSYVYLVLEYCANGELKKYIDRLGGTVSDNQARRFLVPVVTGLLYLHKKNIMHRDLKLANLLLDSQRCVKIADFGMATQLRRPDERHATLCGTPNYMSPDVTSRNHGLETDVWNVGIMLFSMLVGWLPFDDNEARKIMEKTTFEKVKIPEGVSENARKLISSCLEKDAYKRIRLQAILQHPFMSEAKEDISRMSDSGMHTMSTVASTRLTHTMPLSSIPESNISECENRNDMNNHSAKLYHEPLRRRPHTPPVKIVSSPRDLLPPNAGVFGSLKRNPLPSMKRGEDFIISAPPVSSLSKRERDISEERRRQQSSGYCKENPTLSSSDANDVSNQRRGIQRGSSEQNLRQIDKYEKNSNSLRSHRSIEMNSYSKSETHRSREYTQGYERSVSRTDCDDRYDPHENRSGDGNFSERSRSRKNGGDCSGRYRRSRSFEVKHNSNWNPEVNNDMGNSLERRRDRVREPECHRDKEDLGDIHADRVHSCCHTRQHKSWCDRGKISYIDEKASVHNVGSKNSKHFDSNSGTSNRHFHQRTSSRYAAEKALRDVSSESRECSNKILDNIPPLEGMPEPRNKHSKPSRANGHKVSAKMVSKNAQNIQVLPSPLCSERLQPVRKYVALNACNVFYNILDNGVIYLEFLRKKGGKERIEDVCKISADGLRIQIYKPGSGCQPGSNPPVPERGGEIFSYENLPGKHWPKYVYAARLVEATRSKTTKITYYSELAKCLLRENSPDPDFEATFYHSGFKMLCSGETLKISDANGTFHKALSRSSAPDVLQDHLRPLYLHFQEVHEYCLFQEKRLTESIRMTGRNPFPTVLGRKPPGVTTPPSSARGNSQLEGDKENIPVSLQSYQCRRKGVEQMRSIQDRTGSVQTVENQVHSSRSAVQDESSLELLDPGYRVPIKDIGWGTMGSNGVIKVEYMDSSQILFSHKHPTVKFTDARGVTNTYTGDQLPPSVTQRLSQMEDIVPFLVKNSQPNGVSSSSKRVGLR